MRVPLFLCKKKSRTKVQGGIRDPPATRGVAISIAAGWRRVRIDPHSTKKKNRAKVQGVDSRPAGDAWRRHIHCWRNGGVFESAPHLQNKKVAQECDLFILAERAGFEPACPLRQTDFECCKTMADSPPEQVVSGRFVRSRRPRRCKGFRTFRPVSAGGDLKCPRVQIKLRSCVKSRRSCAFARSQARKQRPRQHR